ncbi:MAG TPA: DoxX family protein [Stellaceae bacterium]|nr:DoxX family protein [Stellaceae bacterium]
MSDVMDRVSEAGHDTVLLAARVAMAAIFLPSGFGKLTHLAAFAGMLTQHGVPDAALLAPIGACVEFFGALLILTGTRLRWAALMMAIFTLVAALISHRFWELADAAARANQHIHFMKNIAIIGGFLSLFVAGAGAYSVDHWLANRLRLAQRWR